MATLRIVAQFDVPGNIAIGVCSWGYLSAVDTLVLQCGEEGFGHGVSSPGEFHPRALAEPCVNLSIYTAPIVEPDGLIPIGQWAKRFGSLRAIPRVSPEHVLGVGGTACTFGKPNAPDVR